MAKNLPYYFICWLAFGAIAGMLSPVYSPDNGPMSDQYFWSAKMAQAEWGLLFGAACALAFTLFQNTWNKSRSKAKSRMAAIGIWMGMKFVFAGISYLFIAA